MAKSTSRGPLALESDCQLRPFTFSCFFLLFLTPLSLYFFGGYSSFPLLQRAYGAADSDADCGTYAGSKLCPVLQAYSRPDEVGN
jgi:hypothetical protein